MTIVMEDVARGIGPHLTYNHEAERKRQRDLTGKYMGFFETSKPTSSNTHLPTRRCLLILLKEFYQLCTKYSNL